MSTDTTTTKSQPVAVLTMGLPGAGKSTVIARMGLDTMPVVDPDRIKEGHPDYDPKNPEALHDWSKRQAEAAISNLVADGSDLLIDGTGTNVEKMVRRAQDLQAAGYTVKVLYVQVSLQTALARNAARERTVPEYVVRDKAEAISTAAEIVARYVDMFVTVPND